jgi:hypothetical protein
VFGLVLLLFLLSFAELATVHLSLAHSSIDECMHAMNYTVFSHTTSRYNMKYNVVMRVIHHMHALPCQQVQPH